METNELKKIIEEYFENDFTLLELTFSKQKEGNIRIIIFKHRGLYYKYFRNISIYTSGGAVSIVKAEEINELYNQKKYITILSLRSDLCTDEGREIEKKLSKFNWEQIFRDNESYSYLAKLYNIS